jgi:hypothetical protein
MLTKEQYLEAHSKFYDLLQNEELSPNKYLPYDEFEIQSSHATGGLWMVFHLMASDLIRELLNEINLFYSTLINLNAWEKVLKDYSMDMKSDILVEILNPILLHSLNLPYAVKNRFIYASVMLLRETATLIDRNSESKEFIKKYISIKTLKKFKHLSEEQKWESFNSFLTQLEQIHSEQYIKDTSNFRHRSQHLLPPKIEMGISSLPRRIEHKKEDKSYMKILASLPPELVERIKYKKGDVSYAIGGESPLSISKLLTSLHSEHEAFIKAFQAFWLLLQDLLKMWEEKCV